MVHGDIDGVSRTNAFTFFFPNICWRLAAFFCRWQLLKSTQAMPCLQSIP
jgi:hypothetical protein